VPGREVDWEAGGKGKMHDAIEDDLFKKVSQRTDSGSPERNWAAMKAEVTPSSGRGLL